MNTTDQVQFATIQRAVRPANDPPALPPSYHQLVSPVRRAIVCARRFLLDRQCSDGGWMGRQIGDASLPAQLILLLAYFGREDTELAHQAANAVLRDEAASGGWPALPGGPPDVSTSVQAYFALKVAGHKPNRPHMEVARKVIRELGGADAADAATRTILALFGQINFETCGAKAATSNSAAVRPLRPLEVNRSVRELFVAHSSQWPTVDDESPPRGNRFWNVIWTLIAEQARVGNETRTWSAACDEQICRFAVVDLERDEARPCLGISPALDTVVVREALRLSGIRTSGVALHVPQSLLVVAATATFDLAVLARRHFGPDCRDNVEAQLPPVITMLGDRRAPNRAAQATEAAANDRAVGSPESIVKEFLTRQNSDGGWSARDLGDEPSDPATTSGVLAALARDAGNTREAVQRGIEYLLSTQRPDGSWDSAHGVRFIHGTSLAIQGLAVAGLSMDHPAVEGGVNWLVVHQQESGGWGEAAPPTITHSEMVAAPPSAIQTAWAVLALVAAGQAGDDAVRLGVQFLVDTQSEDGDWQDAQFTFRDPVAGKYYRNDMHSAAESLAALACWAVAASGQEQASTGAQLRLVADEIALA